jgi:membrane associated rhomboid family serine protease
MSEERHIPEARVPPPVAGGDEQTYCYRHPDTPTRLRCSRCDRPICGHCATPANVGQHCPECVAEGRRTVRRVKSTMMAAAPAVVALVVINVAIYLVQIVAPVVTQRFSSFPPAIAVGEWWRLLTAMFLHAPGVLFHILFNMLVLWIYGPHVEKAFGTLRFVALYLTAGFFASATSYAFGTCNPSLGASGAIFGVVGMLLAFLYNRRRSMFVRDYMNGLLVFIGLNAAIGFMVPRIDWLAHLGGLVAGVALGAGVDRTEKVPVAQVFVVGAVIAAGVALVMWRTATFAC